MWGTYSLAGSDDDWTTVGPEAEHNWLNVSGLESGSEYDIRVVAMNNGDNKTVSEPVVVYIGARKGRFGLFTAMPFLLRPSGTDVDHVNKVTLHWTLLIFGLI